MRVNLAWLDVVGSLALGWFTFDAESVESLDYAALVGYNAAGWGTVFGIIRAMHIMKAKKACAANAGGEDGGSVSGASDPLSGFGGYFGYYFCFLNDI